MTNLLKKAKNLTKDDGYLPYIRKSYVCISSCCFFKKLLITNLAVNL